MPTGISTSLDASGNGNWLNPHWNGSGHSQRETLAQIQAAHLGIGDEFGRRAGEQYLAVIDDAGAVDEVERLADIMVGDQHADAARLEIGDEIPNVADRQRVDAREGFVAQHDRRSEEHTSELQSL